MSLARPVAWLLPLVLWASLVVLSPAAVAEADPVGVWPLQPEPQVMRGFDPPDVVWGAGHRGVDLLGSAGQAVHAALPGTVTFAGMIAGRGVVVVDHGDTRTTYEPVTSSVDVGALVPQGAVIGTLASAFSHCPPLVCLHWGWLRGETYLDPLGLVGAGPVRLLPLWRDDPVAPSRRPSTGSSVERALADPHLAQPVRRRPAAAGGARPPASRGPGRSSGPRMCLLVGLAEPFGGDVGVELGGGQARVAEHLLHRSQVGAALQQVGRGRVTEPVGSDVRRTGHLGDALVHERADRPLVDPAAAGADEQRGARVLGDEPGRPTLSQRSRARAAGWPNGTLRSLRPLPKTRTRLRSRSTSSTSSATSSPTRIPVA